jgi:hypothetical protein
LESPIPCEGIKEFIILVVIFYKKSGLSPC